MPDHQVVNIVKNKVIYYVSRKEHTDPECRKVSTFPK